MPRRQQCDSVVGVVVLASATTASHAFMNDATSTTRQRRGRGRSDLGQLHSVTPRSLTRGVA